MGERVETLKRRTPLLEYLRKHNWKGRPAGRFEHVGLCPLHEESRPSFYVNVRKNVFYCHGCGHGGDLIRFLQLSRRSSFRESVACLDPEIPSAKRTPPQCWSRPPPSIGCNSVATPRRSTISTGAECTTRH